MSLVAGVDSSTQSTKIEIRDLVTGELIGQASAGHPPASPPVSEQSPESWWSALQAAFGQLSGHLDDVVAVSVAAQQHGLVCVDEVGNSLRPAQLWNDTTSANQAHSLVARLGAPEWARIVGVVPVPSITITKLAWLKENEPAIFERATAFMLPHDYLTSKLTDRRTTDRGDASGTGWWSPINDRYEPDLLALVTDDPTGVIHRLPEVLGPRDIAGQLTVEAAAATGLREGIPVACGTGDNMAAAYGLGLSHGDIAMSLGTSGTVYGITESPVSDETGTVAGFADANGQFLPLVATLNATKVTDTIARLLGVDASGFAALARTAMPDPRLVVTPYFDGERTPNLPNATGAIAGLDNWTSRGDIAAAAHIGVICGLLHGIDALESVGVETDGTLHLTGGGARSEAFQQWVADLWGRPIAVHATSEAVATGAAKQAAAVAMDTEPHWHDKPDFVIEPRQEVDRTAYRETYRSVVY
ncbi:MAG: xylulokinase [Acidimicrobiia bacterium]|nr:MAG: xylulokinase [Acidimicrobiia bacterium]